MTSEVTRVVADALDVPRLRKALEHVTAHPEEWNQRSWLTRRRVGTACRTTACLAGTVVLQAGLELVWVGGLNADFAYAEVVGGRSVWVVAAELLELPDDEFGWYVAAELFQVGNTLADLWHWAAYLSGGAIEVPSELVGAPRRTTRDLDGAA